MKKKVYQQPKIKIKIITLNMFFRRIPYKDEANMFLAACYYSCGDVCGPGCGVDCHIPC